MNLRLSALTILLAQSVILVGPGEFLLCVHEDGRSQYELATHPCCEAVEGSRIVRQVDGARELESDCDHCQDFPATLTQIPPGTSDVRILPPGAERLDLPMDGRSLPLVSQEYFPRPGAFAHGPPPGRALLFQLSTVVLQV